MMKSYFAAAIVSLASSSVLSFEAVPSDEVVWMTAGLDASMPGYTDENLQQIADHKLIYPSYSAEPWIMFEWSWNLGGELKDSVSQRVTQTQADLDQLYKLLDVARSATHEASHEVIAETRTRVSKLDFDGDRRFDLRVKIRNGNEVIDVPDASIRDGIVTWGFPHYDSRVEIDQSDDGVLQGVWYKVRNDTSREMKFLSFQDQRMSMSRNRLGQPLSRVFGQADTAESDVRLSRWRVNFTKSGDAIAEFHAHVPPPKALDPSVPFQIFTGYTWKLHGTFLTPTGDFRYLAGELRGTRDNFCGVGSYLPVTYQLSTFDGAHAFLFRAISKEDGSLRGDFWSGNWHHETWTAVRDDNATLPDAFEQTTITDEKALADAVFKDIDGNPTRVLDALDETKAKARVLEIFGTWCPNCSDAGRELVSLKEKYGDDLGIVALAFEVTEDFARSSQQVQRHHAHIGSDWEILIAGLSDKAKATETLGFLDKVRSYPTLIFLNERNEVQAVYSGFSGPATGDAYTNQRERFEALIERMINE